MCVTPHIHTITMFFHYLKTALRSFTSQKVFTFINMAGLAIGLASAILIILFIFDELTFDTVHPDAENTYRVGTEFIQEDGSTNKIGYSPGIWAYGLKENYPEVKEATGLFWFGYPTVINNKPADKILLSEKLYWVDESFEKVIHFPVVKGSKESAFEKNNAIALNESMAEALFGDEDPLGKTLTINHPFLQQEYPMEVTAVYQDLPANTHVQGHYFANMKALEKEFGEGFNNSWDNFFVQTYFQTEEGADINKLEEGLAGLVASNTDQENPMTPVIIPIRDIHFDDEIEWVTEGAGDINYMYIFGSIAILILLIAGINYMNLATARSTKRAKEIGLRKALGGTRSQLITQFFGESLLTACISMLLALGIITILLPYFNQLAGKSFTLASLARPDILAIIAGTVVLVALFSGIYPAIYLSGFKPITVLRNKFAPGKGPEVFRRALVVFQFTISVILIICTSVVYLQMNMIRSSKLSEAGEQIVSIRFGGNAPANKYEVYRQSLMRDLELQQVSMANHLPRQEYFGNINLQMRFPGLNENEYDWNMLNVEHNFPEMFGLEMLAGKGFENREISDSSTVAPFIMNEAAAKVLDLDLNQALGTSVSIRLGQEQTLTGQVIGIVKDFPYKSMRTAIEPMLMTTFPSQIDKIVYVRLPKDKLEEKLTYLKTTWKEVIPGVGFDYWFLDSEFDRMYANESRMADLTEVFSLLAILIACLGVYGLASYLAERKMKEIGIRKILGASVQQIMGLLSKTFALILILSSIIAVPVAYFLMQDWLQNFVYRIGIAWWILVASVVAILVLTAITVSYDTIRAARLNPVDYLRED